jgi:hypothetical protein
MQNITLAEKSGKSGKSLRAKIKTFFKGSLRPTPVIKC